MINTEVKLFKNCSTCKEIKSTLLFYRCKSNKSGLQSSCKVCCNLRTTSYARENKDKIHPKLTGYALKRRYGMSIQDYENLLIKQNHQCAICKVDECASGRNFAVDHCHDTGKIRGLLCSHCNIGIGHFNDNPNLIQKAIDYLNEDVK